MARMGCIGGLSACVISLHTKWVDLRRDCAVTGIQSLYSSFHSLRGTRGARSRRAARVRSPPRSADSMSIRNLAFGTRQPPLSPHTRLALSVVACAVRDIKGHDALLHRSAARFLNPQLEASRSGGKETQEFEVYPRLGPPPPPVQPRGRP